MAADLSRVTIPTPLGPLTVVVSPEGVVCTTTGDPGELDELLGGRPVERPHRAIVGEVEGYFARRRRTFRTPPDLRLVTTPFGRAVLERTCEVPYGEMATYGDIAGAAGRPGAARAAGTALRRSPIELFVPCHRIVPAGPGYGRYGGHEDRRATLLRLEGAI